MTDTEELERFKYPRDIGIWGIEIDGQLEEIEVTENESGELVVYCSDLEDIGIDIDALEECEDDNSCVLATSLVQENGEDAWCLID